MFVHAARAWWPRGAGPHWLAVLPPAALLNIWAGHYAFLVGALFLMGWRQLEDRPVHAGVLFGLLLVKPHLAILVPLVLALRCHWWAMGAAAATVAALIEGTTLAYGWVPWHAFVFGVGGTQAAMIDAGGSFFGAMSTSAATAVL